MSIDVTAAPYSCDKTGSADCTTALNTAITDASAGGTSAGQELFFPAGTYKITGQGLSLSSAGNLRIRGENMGSTFLRHSSATASSATLQTPADATARGNIHIQDITFDGVSGSTGASYAFICAGSNVLPISNIRFINVRFQNYVLGGIRNAALMDAALIQNCEFTAINTGNPATDSSGSSISGRFSNSRILGCYFHDTGTADTANGVAWCIYLNFINKNNVISGNTFKTIAGGGIVTSASADTQATIYNCSITGNIFEAVTYSSIQAQVCNGISITGNSVHSVDGTGNINIAGDLTGFTVSNNTYVSTGSTSNGNGFLIQRSNANGVVSGNTVIFPTNCIWGAGFTIYGCDGLNLVDNTVVGLCYGIHLFDGQPGSTRSRIHIADNRLVVPTNATQVNSGGAYIQRTVGSGMATVGILINGPANDVNIVDNRVSGMDAELGIANVAGASGPASNVFFRSGNPLSGSGHVVQYSSAALPVGFSIEPRNLHASARLPPYGVFTAP